MYNATVSARVVGVDINFTKNDDGIEVYRNLP
jgi:hypothetical protein